MDVLDGIVVVLTGATGRLGPAVARMFAERGAQLAMPVLEVEGGAGRSLASSLPGGSDRHRVLEADLTDVAATESVAASIRADIGRPSILLHLVGGILGGKSMIDTSEEEWLGQIELNLLCAVHTIRAFLPDVARAAHGRIITTSSARTMAPTARYAAYVATKAALEAMTISVGRELAGTDATANVLLIGKIGAQPGQTPAESLAATMLWLCSPEGGAVNGQRIPVIGRGAGEGG